MYKAITLCPDFETTYFKTFSAALDFAESKLDNPNFRSVRIYRDGSPSLLAQAYAGDKALR